MFDVGVKRPSLEDCNSLPSGAIWYGLVVVASSGLYKQHAVVLVTGCISFLSNER